MHVFCVIGEYTQARSVNSVRNYNHSISIILAGRVIYSFPVSSTFSKTQTVVNWSMQIEIACSESSTHSTTTTVTLRKYFSDKIDDTLHSLIIAYVGHNMRKHFPHNNHNCRRVQTSV